MTDMPAPDRTDSTAAAPRIIPSLRFSSLARDEMVRRAADGYPHEVCGLMIGRADGDSIRVERVSQARNLRTDRLRDRYVLDPDDFVAADAAARRDGLEVVGIWHTHPDHPPVPSQTDLEAAWEGYSYVILSVRRDGVADVRSWTLDGPRFTEQAIEETTV